MIALESSLSRLDRPPTYEHNKCTKRFGRELEKVDTTGDPKLAKGVFQYNTELGRNEINQVNRGEEARLKITKTF